jgi:hypothetical protein
VTYRVRSTNTRNNLVYDFSVAPPFIAFTGVRMSPCPVTKMIGGPSLFAKRVWLLRWLIWATWIGRSRSRTCCQNLLLQIKKPPERFS